MFLHKGSFLADKSKVSQIKSTTTFFSVQSSNFFSEEKERPEETKKNFRKIPHQKKINPPIKKSK